MPPISSTFSPQATRVSIPVTVSRQPAHFRSNLHFGRDMTDRFIAPEITAIEPFFTDKWARKAEEMKAHYQTKGYDLVKLSIGGPQEAPSEVFLNALADAGRHPEKHKYTHTQGAPALKSAFAKMLEKQFGLGGLDTAKELLVLDGINAGLSYFIQNVLKNHEGQGSVLSPSPGYPTFDNSLALGGFTKIPLPLTPENKFLPDLQQAVQQAGDKVQKPVAVILNYPNNPTGAHATGDYIRQVLTFARKNNILVISDMAYGYYHSLQPGNQASAPSVAAIARKMDAEQGLTDPEALKYSDLVVEFYSISKLGYAGDRVGCVVGPEYLVKPMDKYFTLMRTTSLPEYIQDAAATLLNSEQLPQDVKKMNALYRKRYELTCNSLEKLGWPVNRQGGPYYYWGPIQPKERTGCDTSDAFAEKILKETGCLIIPGSEFGKEWDGYVRIAMTQPEPVLQEFFNRLKANGFDYSQTSPAGAPAHHPGRSGRGWWGKFRAWLRGLF